MKSVLLVVVMCLVGCAAVSRQRSRPDTEQERQCKSNPDSYVCRPLIP